MIEVKGKEKERAVLVGIGKEYTVNEETGMIDRLEELSLLAATAGAEIVGIVTQTREQIEPTYYIGKGKAEELRQEVSMTDANLVIFDNDLTPAQGSNLEKFIDTKVIDRSGLILDIFAQRARTRQARTQVELAQLKYLLPRLTRQWTHLSRQEGGIGMRGPGETQLEVDRRRIRHRINHLENILSRIDRQREVSRKNREGVFKVALVGYTNAGKSTLLNALSGAGVAVEDKLFKTLDSVTRHVRFDSSPDLLISDTVGFIRDLPHDLVASFKSTLDEVREADCLVHVIDCTNPEWEKQIEVVNDVLADIGASDTPVVMVFNKSDSLDDNSVTQGLTARYPDSFFISALTGEGLDDLRASLVRESMKSRVRLTVRCRPDEGPLLSDIYRYGRVQDSQADDNSIILTFTMPVSAAKKLRLFDRETVDKT